MVAQENNLNGRVHNVKIQPLKINYQTTQTIQARYQIENTIIFEKILWPICLQIK